MAKSYPEQLGQWVKQRDSTQRDRNLAAFLAVRDDVSAAVEAGFSVKTVWVNMVEFQRIEYGYEVFLSYVNRLIRQPQVDQAGALVAPEIQANPDTPLAKSKVRAKKLTINKTKLENPDSFTFNPVPNKEELL